MAKCKGKTAAGAKCKRNAKDNSAYCCPQHDPDAADALKKTWHDPFFEAFEACGIVRNACEAAGISTTTVYDERKASPEFAARWAEVEEHTTQMMEAEAFRRAHDGVSEPVFHKGEVVGSIQKYSDTLLIFMLKARRPEKYRERVAVEHGGAIEHRQTGVAVPEDASSEDLTQVADELAARRARRAAAAA